MLQEMRDVIIKERHLIVSITQVIAQLDWYHGLIIVSWHFQL